MLTYTEAQLSQLVSEAATKAALAAVRDVNTVADRDRPPATRDSGLPTLTRQPYSLARMIIALREGSWRGAELERDVVQATKELYLPDAEPRSIAIPTRPQAFVDVAVKAGLPVAREAGFRKYAEAVKAMGEGSGSAGGFMVPTQYLQDQFRLGLGASIAYRNAPGVQTIPVKSNVVALPRESVFPASSDAAEAAALTPTDATLAQQTITIKKQYGYNLFSNELLADATPEFEDYIGRSLARSVALVQDLRFLEGTGAGNQVTGLGSYAGLTAGYAPAANGDSYSAAAAADKLIDLVYGLRAVGVEPNAWIGHPRTLQSLSKVKDSSGRYILESIGGVFGAAMAIPGAGTLNTQAGYVPGPWKAQLLGIPMLVSSQIPITETQGTANNATHLYLGDFNQAVVLERQAIEIATSADVAFNTDQTAVRVIGRAAPALMIPAAFTKQGGIIP